MPLDLSTCIHMLPSLVTVSYGFVFENSDAHVHVLYNTLL